MHSSTSNFRTLPHGWLSLAVAACFAVLGLAAWEMFWRTRGFVPTLTDTEALWCHERARAKGPAVVILGSSRLQRGIDPAVLARELHGHDDVVELALDGSNPFPVLADLARDPDFAGLVVLEYMPRRWFTPDSAPTARSDGFLATCANPSLVAGVEAALERELQRRLAILSSELHPITIASYAYRHRALPRDSHESLRADRFLATYFHGASGGSVELDRWEAPLSPPALDERLAAVQASVTAIRRRGGLVVLYRPPVTDGVLDDEERRFPARTWLPRVAARLGVPYIDFADVAALRALPCPDGEHLDASDVPAATEALARELAHARANR